MLALPAGEKLDPRAAIAGRYVSQEPVNTGATASTSNKQSSPGQHAYWESGLFDKGSWIEAQSGWARSVVTGRARLGGLPCGKLPLSPPYARQCVAKLAWGWLGTRGCGKGAGLCNSCLFAAADGHFWHKVHVSPFVLLSIVWAQAGIHTPMALRQSLYACANQSRQWLCASPPVFLPTLEE